MTVKKNWIEQASDAGVLVANAHEVQKLRTAQEGEIVEFSGTRGNVIGRAAEKLFHLAAPLTAEEKERAGIVTRR